MLKFVPNFYILLSRLKEEILDLLFPPICGICGKFNKNWICDECKNRIKKFEKQKLIISKEEINKVLNFNYLCNTKKERIYFDQFYYLFKYEAIIRKLLLKYKFFNCSYLSNLFANIILKDKNINYIFENYDIMIPVPMDRIKKLKRGYNQTELITNKIRIIMHKNSNQNNKLKINEHKKINNIDFNLKIFHDNEILSKIKLTKTQSTLSSIERKENIKDAFLVKNIENVKNKKIILFDDICTTGSTVNEISKILKEFGAKEILVLVIAKD